jgi:hypothetical protein
MPDWLLSTFIHHVDDPEESRSAGEIYGRDQPLPGYSFFVLFVSFVVNNPVSQAATPPRKFSPLTHPVHDKDWARSARGSCWKSSHAPWGVRSAVSKDFLPV